MLWTSMYPDKDAALYCSKNTLIQWNLNLHFPSVKDEYDVWVVLRARILEEIPINLSVITDKGLVEFKSLIELNRSGELLNFLIPFNTTLSTRVLDKVIEYYVEVNFVSNGFLRAVCNNIVKSTNYEHACAIMFPSIKDTATKKQESYIREFLSPKN